MSRIYRLPPTDFAHAAALGYSATSGDISISGPAGVNGTPGAGIEGTVGNLELIAQSVSIAAHCTRMTASISSLATRRS